MEGLCLNFDPDNHLVSDASAHWVLKRMLSNQEKGKGQFLPLMSKFSILMMINTCTHTPCTVPPPLPPVPKCTGLAQLILERVHREELVLWVSSNRGAFVLCALVSNHLELGNTDHLKLASELRDALARSNSEVKSEDETLSLLKGQQALASELDKLISDNEKS